VGVKLSSVDGRLLGLLGPYHQHAIGTFNTCSRGLTHQSLTDTGGSYNLGGASFPHTTPWPSQQVISTSHLRAPPDLQINQALETKSKFKFKEHMTTTWSSDQSAIYCNLYLRLVITNDLSLAIGFTRINQKVTLMQLGQQFNFYNLMHIQES
jgi:hypothetical protein